MYPFFYKDNIVILTESGQWFGKHHFYSCKFGSAGVMLCHRTNLLNKLD